MAMTRVLTIFFVFALFLQGQALGSNDLSDVLKGIQKKYRDLPGLSITYTREVITRSMAMLGSQVKGDLAFGRIYFMPPRFLRLEQETPKPETVIANGNTLWWYIPEKKSVYRYRSQKFGKELRLLCDIFRGLTRVEESFQVAIAADNGQEGYRIELKPNPPLQEIDFIVLAVTTAYDIRAVDIHNQLGNTTRFELRNLIVKEDLEKSFFRFIVPEGVRLVEEED